VAESAPVPPSGRQIANLRIEDLRFDSLNPRLPSRIEGGTREDVLGWMLDDSSILELMGSIGEQGYFEGEPLLVVPYAEGSADPPYVVVEGNRRLAAVLLLLHPDWAPVRKASVAQVAKQAKHKPKKLPAVLFAKHDDIADYLGYRHVTGIKEWDPLAKAKYVRRLAAKLNVTTPQARHRHLARQIGSQPDYVARLLAGLSVFEHASSREFYQLDGVQEEDINFSLLTTALSYRAIAKFIGASPTDEASKPKDGPLKEFLDWTYRRGPTGKTVLGESRNFKVLAKVVANPDALKALRVGRSLDDAALLTDEPLVNFRQLLWGAESSMRVATDQFHLVTGLDASDLQTASGVAALARDLANLVRSRLQDVDD
jgi:hypothetical protein